MALINDVSQFWGGDISASLSPTGGILPASGTVRGQQRILRRLLTNPGDYIFHTDYGAGLPGYVGSVASVDEITALIRGQILLEDAVSRTPAPVITVTPIDGGISVQILYNDAPSGQPVALSFSVNK
jgi:hypothetical protein